MYQSILFKIAILGDGGVGKSTMLQRLITNEFIPCQMTIGTDFKMYDVQVNNTLIKLQLWDLAGEDRFRFLIGSYCRGASGVLLCYDITRYITFKNLDKWYSIAKENADDPVVILVGGKKDLEFKRTVPEDLGQQYKEQYQLDYFFETSSKSGVNNKLIFETLAKAIAEKREIELT
ncbi:MAG: Small GTP-binding domain protein [Promethearchaeota archaeon]|nr:MAG: Small GTP-binding domain protein [Candidatus Lokiarchaeota archaeon]